MTCSLAEREMLRKCMYDKSGNISLSLAFAKAAKNGEIEDRKKIKKK